jgi:hypothetical protein
MLLPGVPEMQDHANAEKDNARGSEKHLVIHRRKY